MTQSMTGYGRAEVSLPNEKILIEIRSVNGKTADIGIKNSYIPRSKEAELRKMLTEKLQRGSIDIYISSEAKKNLDRPINKDLFIAYYQEIQALQALLPQSAPQTDLISTILRIPEVMASKAAEPDESQWQLLQEGVLQAAESLIIFRQTEGKRLTEDILERVSNIEGTLSAVEAEAPSRIDSVKERLQSRLAELGTSIQIDNNRFEQELIYYLEKLDVTEEMVRLRQHCRFFRDTLAQEPYPGRKLSFIAQEMGREINTLGSKANHANIQQQVVGMKDELEKIKEQCLNIL
jgi:TIGR00255 family protein